MVLSFIVSLKLYIPSAINIFNTDYLLQHTRLVDVLWCQPIKLIQVVSTSEFHEYYGTTLFLLFSSKKFTFLKY